MMTLRQKISGSIALLTCSTVVAFGNTELAGFDRYQIILDKKPFGDPPPPPPKPAAVKPAPVITAPGEGPFKNFRMSSIVQDDDGTNLRVGLHNKAENKSVILRVGEAQEGIELISASFEDEEAILSKGNVTVKMSLSEATPQSMTQDQGRQARQSARPRKRTPITPNRPTPSVSNNSKKLSYAERRRMRQDRTKELEAKRAELAQKEASIKAQQEEATRRAEAAPKYSGEELKQHLESYQMEIIRRGLPPLPIPLTEDMDEQLVNEGVLPARPGQVPKSNIPDEELVDSDFGAEDLTSDDLEAAIEEGLLDEDF